MNFTEIISLIGKSEKSDDVRQMLSKFGIELPLKRPPRGDDDVNFQVKNHPIELCFAFASDDQIEAGAMEGELIFDTVFFYPESFVNHEENKDVLPFGFFIKMTRLQAREKFGTPQWTSSSALHNDRWIIDKFRVLACFTDDEKSIYQFSIWLNS